MKTLFDIINDLPENLWNYYEGINNNIQIEKPFIITSDYKRFIVNYFKRGGKIDIFESCNINIEGLRLPNHICSVFFLGIIIYNNTSLHKKYKIENNAPGYESFPFIWFLIALFHDNAYQIEEDKDLARSINNIEDLKTLYGIENFFFDKKSTKCQQLINSREKYFSYRLKEWGKIDHGLLGGILLFDRLVKIRKEKKKNNEENLFWGQKLVNQYKLAADAISIHNIWLPEEKNRKTYKKSGLSELINFTPIKFKDFPLFYILGLVDTIEPFKIFQDLSDEYILRNFKLELNNNIIKISVNKDTLDFQKIIDKVQSLKNWLDIDIKIHTDFVELKIK